MYININLFLVNINSMAKFTHPLEKVNIHYYYIMLLFYLLIKYLVVLETTIYLSTIIHFCNGEH